MTTAGVPSAADATATRVALWRALHLELDPAPHILQDALGATLAAPEAGWRDRPDMHPEGTKPFRAAIVARGRLVEDLVLERLAQGVRQYVILGAGLDTFALRHPDVLARGLEVFEVDQPKPQAWKRERLAEIGLAIPPGLRFAPVNFEAGEGWLDALKAVGFDIGAPAVVASMGVSMYLTRAANAETLRQAASLAPGSRFAMSFMPPFDLADSGLRPGLEQSAEGARSGGTPWISFFTPAEITAMACDAGFTHVRHLPAAQWTARYFAGRTDGLQPAQAEELLVAEV
jgi:methyltransferase (TIGR00027 family)